MPQRNTPKRYSKRQPQKQRQDFPIEIRPEAFGLIFLALALLTALSLLSASRGSLTEGWLNFLGGIVGWGMYLAPFLLGGMGIWLLRRFAVEDVQEKWEKPIGLLLLFLLLLTAFQLISPGGGFDNLSEPGGGGLVGWAIGETLVSALGLAGSVVVLVVFGVLGLILVSNLSLAELVEIGRNVQDQIIDWRRRRALATLNHQPVMPLPGDQSHPPNLLQRVLPSAQEEIPAREGAPSPGASGGYSTSQPGAPGTAQAATPPGMLFPRVVGAQTWQLPPIEDIFEEGIEQEISQQEIRQRVKIIEETLASFGIEARVREINPGPAVTQFGVEPGYLEKRDSEGRQRKVRVARIVNLTNDLALALSASPIRIEAPVPGRPYVGIEVPNATKSLVSLRSVMESENFLNDKSPLRFGLGRDVAGQAVVADLAAMPHLLIAGATGSGKSVCINAIIACYLATHTPETLRLLMVDPKMVELTNYNGVPHLLAPVVTDLERVVGVLNWATREMDRRYKVFSRLGVRNLVGYNELMASRGEKVMPYIVIIIDELADLMMMSPDEVERTVTRIAQMARATGIHLIIATQRPSVDVVTGLIKANFPARIAFAVTSQIDSRVILDTPGAERLLGRGDMLFMAPDSSKLQRLLGVFVSDRELSRLVRYWKGTHVVDDSARPPAGTAALPPQKPAPAAVPEAEPLQQPLWAEFKLKAEDMAQEDEDDLLAKAIEVVQSHNRASVSLLQRRLRIGYARAARLIDIMEEQGIIGPDEGGGRSRQVLVSRPDAEEQP
jgi:S-DNA-T family DNA segregation ATPase FtsK/SpoIIIE